MTKYEYFYSDFLFTFNNFVNNHHVITVVLEEANLKTETDFASETCVKF
jgi:hypothetical protein